MVKSSSVPSYRTCCARVSRSSASLERGGAEWTGDGTRTARNPGVSSRGTAAARRGSSACVGDASVRRPSRRFDGDRGPPHGAARPPCEAAGEVALESGFRSFDAQQRTYARHVAERGSAADLVSARPGHSEHQSGLAADVVGCAGGCGTFDDFAASPQGQWVAANSWEYGWIVRYVEGASDVTGYSPEAWHLRYVGPELARAYHEGSWTSLEEFFGLPAAPNYAG